MSRLRILLLHVLAQALLPRGVWLGKHFGAYTQRWDIVFGRLDSRGVLQGYDPKKVSVKLLRKASAAPVAPINNNKEDNAAH